MYFNPDADLTIPAYRRFIVDLDDNVPDPRGLVATLARTHQFSVHLDWYGALNGFSAEVSQEVIEALRHVPGVKRITQNSRGDLAGIQTNPPSWGLDRIDQRDLPLNAAYQYQTTASGVHLYVHDTGIYYSHNDFGGRVDLADSWRISTYNNSEPQNVNDCPLGQLGAGHGTAVASLAGGATYGVAKGVTLHAVKTVECGDGPWAENFNAGIALMLQFLERPAVAVIATVFRRDDLTLTMEDGVRRAIDSGVVVVAAAGNNLLDACSRSPGWMSQQYPVMTAGSSSRFDDRQPDTNFGPCITLFAPGEQVVAAGISSPSDEDVENGTSFAAPHVAGAAALYFGLAGNRSPQEVKDRLVGLSTVNRLRPSSLGAGSPNRLLYTLFLQEGVSGPAELYTESNGTYYSNAQFGVPPYTYQWYQNGLQSGCTGSSCTFSQSWAGEFEVTLRTTDATGYTAASGMWVTVSCRPGDICPL